MAQFQRGDAMALPFPAHSFDAAVMALVIFFVPEPAKGVAEMVRVAAPGGTVAAYAWDVAGGGFPLEPIQTELRNEGFSPPRPNAEVSKMDALQKLWTDAGLVDITTRRIDVQRSFTDFDDFRTAVCRNAGRRRGADQITGPRAAEARQRRPHHLQRIRQRDLWPRAGLSRGNPSLAGRKARLRSPVGGPIWERSDK